MNSNSKAVFTISSKNYVHYAVTMLKSVEKNNQDVDLFLILVDKREPVNLEELNINIIWVEDLGIKDFDKISFKYNILELNTNVKPTSFKRLFEKYQKVIYLDPDIYVYSTLSNVFNILDNSSIAVTPHMLQPQYVHQHQIPDIVSEVENLKTGPYNLGFIALNRDEEAIKFLNWWESCCLCCAFDEHESGVFVDQKWVSLVTCYFEKVKIIRHYGMNVAYWNIHERLLTFDSKNNICVNNEQLIFFHFSGHNYVDGKISKISKHLLSYEVKDDSIIQRLIMDYTKLVSQNKSLLRKFKDIDYGFAKYSSGELIEDLARRVYSKYLDKFLDNPFDAGGSFYRFAKKNILTSNLFSKPVSIDTIQLKNSNKVRILEKILLIVHKILGVKRFSLIIRFLRHYSITTNYAKVYFKQLNK